MLDLWGQHSPSLEHRSGEEAVGGAGGKGGDLIEGEGGESVGGETRVGEVGWAEKEKNCKHLPRSPSPREKDQFAGMYDYAAKMSIVLKAFP